MEVSIVIPTKNAGELFETVLRNIRNQEFDGKVDLLVIDSGSSDQTIDIARKYGARIIQIPSHEFNHGLTRNYGIQNAFGEIIILMTQDAIPIDEHWLKMITETFADDRIAGVYVRQIPREDADVLTRRNLECWFTGRDDYATQEIRDIKYFVNLSPIEKYYTCVFDNVCSAIRRKVWEEIPFHRNDFGEDIEWGKRALEAGWQIAYQPNAAVIHSHNRSVVYEYKRTYMCHRKLYELFHLQAIPTLSYFIRHVLRETKNDIGYILLNEHDIRKIIKLCIMAPLLVFVSSLGQYSGARDEKYSVGKKMKGV